MGRTEIEPWNRIVVSRNRNAQALFGGPRVILERDSESRSAEVPTAMRNYGFSVRGIVDSYGSRD
jgi:hypothetical protein